MDYHLHKTSSGYHIVTVPINDKKSATILILIKVGSRNENEQNNGIAHFIEHMLFKGTHNRPSPIQISEEIDQLGADYNAFTSKEYTGFYIKSSSEYLSQSIDILSDMLSNSLFDNNELSKEKNVIIEEINMYNDTPMRQVGNLYEETIFENHPLAYDTAGSKGSVSNLSRDVLVDFFQHHYIAANLVVVLAGDINERESITEVEQKLKVPNTIQHEFTRYNSTQTSPKVRIKYKQSDQAHFCLGVPSFPLGSSMRYALSIFNIIIGGNMSSRLFVELRERRGLCYYISSDNDAYQDTGTWVIQAGVDVNRLEESVEACLVELKKIKNDGITVNEVNKAKKYLKGRLALGLEDSKGIANLYGINLLLEGKIRLPEEILQAIDNVTIDQINSISKDILSNHKVNLAIIGPYSAEVQSNLLNLINNIEF
jgi:predicted Zn-dependent peptidase